MKGMKRRLRSFGRSIRHKVLLGIVLSLVGVGTLGAVSYYYLRQLEETLALAEGVDDLQSDVLDRAARPDGGLPRRFPGARHSP